MRRSDKKPVSYNYHVNPSQLANALGALDLLGVPRWRDDSNNNQYFIYEDMGKDMFRDSKTKSDIPSVRLQIITEPFDQNAMDLLNQFGFLSDAYKLVF